VVGVVERHRGRSPRDGEGGRQAGERRRAARWGRRTQRLRRLWVLVGGGGRDGRSG
jgi:hypothetical protein